MNADIEWIGWLSSLILIATVFKQLHKQWNEQTSEGVSKWLFLGQVFAELGFITYSCLIKNWVFLATNVILLLSNFFGFWLVLHQRKKTT